MNTHKVLAALPAALCGELTSWFEGCADRLIQHTARSAPVSRPLVPQQGTKS